MANNITQWKPTASINLRNFGTETKTFPTYKKLKSNLIELLNQSYDNEVFVSRSKRGEWGEWFENWCISNGKPQIIKQGWM